MAIQPHIAVAGSIADQRDRGSGNGATVARSVRARDCVCRRLRSGASEARVMTMPAAIAVLTVLANLLIMAGEAVLSSFNERQLRARGAIEPPDDVIGIMRLAYPGAFILMGIEGALGGPASPNVLLGGLALFGLAKALKVWAISSLGSRWSYRVLVLPGEPLVAAGPYQFISHPNYLAVVGEIVSVAMIVRAPIAGTIALLGFGWLMIRRIRIEDRALGRLK
jgi:methyltransferase